jgi:predicted GIY-YIG superfamily endonuclease
MKPLVLSLSKDERRGEAVMAFWTYILLCSDDSYYVGHTDDLERRVALHQEGTVCGYTSSRRPLRLAYSEEFESRDDAFRRERQLKGWSRAKKEALVRGDWTGLSRLSVTKKPSAHPSTGSG